jgi:hypothetical protein
MELSEFTAKTMIMKYVARRLQQAVAQIHGDLEVNLTRFISEPAVKNTSPIFNFS